MGKLKLSFIAPAAAAFLVAMQVMAGFVGDVILGGIMVAVVFGLARDEKE